MTIRFFILVIMLICMGCEKTHTTTSISSSLDSTKIRNEYLKKPPLVKTFTEYKSIY